MTPETPPGHAGISRRRLLAGGAVAGGLSLAARGPLPRAATSTGAAELASADLVPAGQPSGLLTSLLDDPLGVPVTGLRMSWIVPASGTATMQTAYQIQLAASPAGFASPVWDSGQVKT